MSYCLSDPKGTSRVGNQETSDLSALLELLIRFKLPYNEYRNDKELHVMLSADENLIGGGSQYNCIYIFNEDESFKWMDLYG